MFSRVTLVDIDTVRLDVDDALDVFRSEVLPQMRQEPGYRGVLVLSNRDGRGVLISFWDIEQAADSRREDGWYAAELERYMTLFRSPPGREHYEVRIAELPEVGLRGDGPR